MEQQLLTAFLEDNRDAARDFFKQYGGIIRHITRNVAPKGHVIDSDDLFFEIVHYILLNKKKIIQDFKYKCKFSTYFYLICRRYALKKIRGETRMPSSDAASPSVEDLPTLLFEETISWDDNVLAALPKAIERLDEKSRIFIRMHFYEKRSIEEIMHMFGWDSSSSVYSKKNRILHKIRKNMKKILEKGSVSKCLVE